MTTTTVTTRSRFTRRIAAAAALEIFHAAALVHDPQVLILDEPANGLDPFGIRQLREMLVSFAESGMTVLVSSHILGEIQQTADYIGILANGVLGYQGGQQENLEELFTEIVSRNRG